MKTGLMWHLVRKDFRYARLWIGLTWLVAAMPIGGRFLASSTQQYDVWNWVFCLQVLAGVLIALSTVRLVQLDTFVTSSAFIRTRPVSQGAIITAKLLVVIAGLILPVTLLRMAQIATLGLGVSAADYLLLFSEIILMLCAVTFTAMIPALFTRNIGNFMLVAIGCGLVYAAGLFLWNALNPMGEPAFQYVEKEQLRISRMVMVQLLATMGALAVIFTYARRCSWKRATTVLIIAGLGIALARAFWPLNFVQYLGECDLSVQSTQRPDLSKVNLQFEIPRGWGGRNPWFEGGGYNGVNYQNIVAFTKCTGLSLPWYPVQRGYESTLALSNGHIMARKDSMPPWVHFERLLMAMKIPLGYDIPADQVVKLTLHQYKELDAVDAIKNAELNGTATVEIRRAVVLSALPLQEGASFTSGRDRFTIRKVRYTQEELEITAIRERIHFTLRGGQHLTSPRIESKLINEEKREHSRFTSSGSGLRGSAANYRLDQMEVKYEPAREGNSKIKFTDEWIKGAHFYFATSESGGVVTFPFHLKPLDLSP